MGWYGWEPLWGQRHAATIIGGHSTSVRYPRGCNWPHQHTIGTSAGNSGQTSKRVGNILLPINRKVAKSLTEYSPAHQKDKNCLHSPPISTFRKPTQAS